MKIKLSSVLWISLVAYILIVLISFLSTPYMVSWGAKKSTFIKFVIYVLENPFKAELSGSSSIIGVHLLNLLFWIILLIFIPLLILYLAKRKKRKIMI